MCEASTPSATAVSSSAATPDRRRVVLQPRPQRRRACRWRTRRPTRRTPARAPGARPPARSARAGRSPLAISVSRAAARATTPFGPANGCSASSSPCTTAASSSGGDPAASARGTSPAMTRQPRAGALRAAGRGRRPAPRPARPARAAAPAPAAAPAARCRPAPAARRRPAARPVRTGSVTAPARTSSRSCGVALQRRAGHRGPQADLGRDLPALPAQRPVPQRRVDPSRASSTAARTSASSSSGGKRGSRSSGYANRPLGARAVADSTSLALSPTP